MKHYYFSDNNQQLGPFTLDELKAKRLKKSTLVWTDGLQDWTTADTLDELKDFVISEPPPLPSKKTIEPDNTVKIKLTPLAISSGYTKEGEATFVGIVLLLTPIIIKLSGVFSFETEESYNQARVFIAITSLTIRIFVTVWVISIANRQNRNSTGWGWFAFFLPSISLIIIGVLNKLPLKINIDNSLSIDEQITILKQKATELKNDFRYNEALSVFMKIKEHNVDYPMIDEEIKICKDKIQATNNSLIKEKETVPQKPIMISFETNKGKIELDQNNSFNSPEPGKKVFKNGQKAPTGKYKFGFMWYVHIENGIVTKVTLF